MNQVKQISVSLASAYREIIKVGYCYPGDGFGPRISQEGQAMFDALVSKARDLGCQVVDDSDSRFLVAGTEAQLKDLVEGTIFGVIWYSDSPAPAEFKANSPNQRQLLVKPGTVTIEELGDDDVFGGFL